MSWDGLFDKVDGMFDGDAGERFATLADAAMRWPAALAIAAFLVPVAASASLLAMGGQAEVAAEAERESREEWVDAAIDEVAEKGIQGERGGQAGGAGE